MERTLLTDDDWATIDGRLCLVTTFVPMAKVQGDSVIAMSATMPYGSVHIKCEELLDDITGFITHKTDFAMLWAAFKCAFGDEALGVGIIISGVPGNFSISSITMSTQSHYSILK
jgi:hypothetical protein